MCSYWCMESSWSFIGWYIGWWDARASDRRDIQKLHCSRIVETSSRESRKENLLFASSEWNSFRSTTKGYNRRAGRFYWIFAFQVNSFGKKKREKIVVICSYCKRKKKGTKCNNGNFNFTFSYELQITIGGVHSVFFRDSFWLWFNSWFLNYLIMAATIVHDSVIKVWLFYIICI